MKEGLEKDTKKVDSLTVKDGETNSEVGKKKGKEERPPTKVVVRRLPPTMTEEEFLQQIEPLPPVDYKYYVPADTSLSPNSFCRAYLNFVNQSDIFIFTQKFDGYVFVDSKGLEYPAVVEFAPFQRIPKQRPGRKKDPKAGTLESDTMYTTFLEKLHAQIQETTSAGSNMKQHFFETNVNSGEDSKVSSTPLLDYLRTRHAERLRAREEKRKKDLERKRAREEQRRSAKKSEEEQAVLKVLPSHTTNNTKDKFKEKDLIKPIKKRSDERIKETKSRVGKSYAEERQKQLERREELRKRFSTSNTGNKSSKTVKLQTDQKTGEHSATDVDKNQDSESKKMDSDKKVVENDVKKDLTHEKKSYQYKYSLDSQKHYDYNKRDDDVKRRSRDSDRSNKSKDQYHDRREDRDRMRKKIPDNKKSYNRYDDYNKDKYKKEHNSKKEGINHHAADKKNENEAKIEKVLSDPSNSSNDVKKDVHEIKLDESKHETLVKQVAVPSERSNESPEFSKNNVEPDLNFEKKIESSSDLGEISDELKNSDTELKNIELLQKDSVKSNDKLPLFSSEENPEFKSENETIKSGNDSLNPSTICVKKSEGTDPEKSEKPSCVDDYDDEEEEANKMCKQNLNEKDIACCDETKSESTIIDFKSEMEEEEDLVTAAGSQKRGETILKRRNSMETYDRKSENSGNVNRRDNVRRSSLESGDQHSNSRQLKQKKNERKKVESENSYSKPRDPRTERRIRNKDRPSMEIYRPGMGRFSKQRMEREKVIGSSTEVDSTSPSPSPTLVPKHKSSLINNHTQDS